MTPEEFRAVLAQHGGVLGTQLLDTSKDEEIAGHKTGEMIPPTSVRVKYTTKDGTITARQQDDGTFEVLDDPKGLVSKASGPQGKAPTIHTLPDGSQVEYDPATGGWKPFAAAKPSATAPATKTFPDGTERQWDPASSTWKPIPGGQKPTPAPALNVPPQRPGQTTDLGAVKAQYDAYVAQLWADKSLTDSERVQRYKTYLDTVVQPAFDRAQAEVNAEQQRQQARQQQQEDVANRRADVAQQREGVYASTAERNAATSARQAQTAADQLAFEREKAAYGVGQDAISNALKFLPYQASPAFASQFAAGLNTLSSGGGPVNFTPDAFRINLPDLDQLASLAAQRASAMYGLPAQSGPTAQDVAAQTAQSVPPPSAPPPQAPPYPQPGGTGMVGRFGQ